MDERREQASWERKREESLLRLATAAALETHGRMRPGFAWDLAGEMPEAVRVRIREAGREPDSRRAGFRVRAVIGEYWEDERKAAAPLGKAVLQHRTPRNL